MQKQKLTTKTLTKLESLLARELKIPPNHLSARYNEALKIVEIRINKCGNCKYE